MYTEICNMAGGTVEPYGVIFNACNRYIFVNPLFTLGSVNNQIVTNQDFYYRNMPFNLQGS